MQLPAIYEGQIEARTQEDIDLESSIEQLRAKLEQMQAELDSLETHYETAMRDLAQFTEFNNAYLALRDLISRIELDRDLAHEAMEDELRKNSTTPEPNNHTDTSLEDVVRIRNVTQAARRLFKRISNLTHPDKNKDPNAVNVFRKAKELCMANDIKGLEAIYHSLVHGAGGLNVLNAVSLKTTLDSLHIQIRLTENKLGVFHNSPSGVILREYKAKRPLLATSKVLTAIIQRTIAVMMTQHYPDEVTYSFTTKYR
ncbi:MAG: hypothetical protein ACRC6V_03665 [Bacteroidales bacterium]